MVENKLLTWTDGVLSCQMKLGLFTMTPQGYKRTKACLYCHQEVKITTSPILYPLQLKLLKKENWQETKNPVFTVED